MTKNLLKRDGSDLHAPMEGKKHNAKTVEAAVFVHMKESNLNAKTVEAALFVNMADEDTGVKIAQHPK